jgi:transcriptional activator SPT7
MAPWVCRSALQRSIGKIFYHAGFEEFQPSALDAVTDIASNFFTGLVQSLGLYTEASKIKQAQDDGTFEASKLQKRFNFEETVLHTLDENGLDVEALESYVKDDVERLGSKLGVMHERMKAHLADLLVSITRARHRIVY